MDASVQPGPTKGRVSEHKDAKGEVREKGERKERGSEVKENWLGYVLSGFKVYKDECTIKLLGISILSETYFAQRVCSGCVRS